MLIFTYNQLNKSLCQSKQKRERNQLNLQTFRLRNGITILGQLREDKFGVRSQTGEEPGSARFFLWAIFSYGKNRCNTVGRGEYRESSIDPIGTSWEIQRGPGDGPGKTRCSTPVTTPTVKSPVRRKKFNFVYSHFPRCYS